MKTSTLLTTTAASARGPTGHNLHMCPEKSTARTGAEEVDTVVMTAVDLSDVNSALEAMAGLEDM